MAANGHANGNGNGTLHTNGDPARVRPASPLQAVSVHLGEYCEISDLAQKLGVPIRQVVEDAWKHYKQSLATDASFAKRMTLIAERAGKLRELESVEMRLSNLDLPVGKKKKGFHGKRGGPRPKQQ